MGFWDFLFGRNVTLPDELAITRAVRSGVAEAEADRVDRELAETNARMKYFKVHRSEILEAQAYQKAFARASAEISKSFGWLPYSPLNEPERLTGQQVAGALEVIDGLAATGVLSEDHAGRIRAHLKKARRRQAAFPPSV